MIRKEREAEREKSGKLEIQIASLKKEKGELNSSAAKAKTELEELLKKNTPVLTKDEVALAAIVEALQQSPEADAAWIGKGAKLNDLKRYDEALTALEQAIKLNPKNEWAWGNKGRSLAGLRNRNDEAKEAFEKAVIYSDLPGYKAYFQACIYCLEWKREEALAELGKAIKVKEGTYKGIALNNVEVFGPLFDDPEFKRLTS